MSADAGALIERPLTAHDVPAGVRLSSAAGWNQIAADWSYLLSAGTGRGFTTGDGTLVATAVTLPYAERFGWISMVLVDPTLRGRGLATHLMERAITALDATGRVPVLDATPLGRAVYARMGFHDTWTYRRWRTSGALTPNVASGGGATHVRAMHEGDLAAIDTFDRTVFGSTREPLLRNVLERFPAAAFIAECHGGIGGYVLGRAGRTARHIGPLIATDAITAAALLGRAISIEPGDLIVDVPDTHAAFHTVLTRSGFHAERTLTRMIYAHPTAFGVLERTFAIAGPELG